MRTLLRFWIAAWLLCVALPGALASRAQAAELPIPVLNAHVVDTAHVLKPEQAASLEQRLVAFEQAHGSQIVVLTVSTTQPEGLEAYANRVFESWKLGRKQHNDGILLLVAAQDRRLRIETGYGLEGAIPDAVAKRIVSEIIAPKFRSGDAYGGLDAGVAQIEKLIQGEQLPPPVRRSGQQTRPDAASQPGGGSSLSEILMFGMVAATIAGSFLCLLLGRFVGGLVTGGLVGALIWFMSGSLLLMIAAGVLVFFYLLITGGHGGIFLGGGGLGGGGGGWGGGGGRSGGGGASGGW